MLQLCVSIAWIWAVAGVTAGTETIPEPDLILYGHVCLTGGPATDADDVSVIARATIAAESRDVGTYRMGAQPSASDCRGDADCYVLRVRVETVPDGASPSGTAAVLTPGTPAMVALFIKEGSAPEAFAGEVFVSDRGVIQQSDLNATPITADINNDQQTDSADFVLFHAALAGPETQNAQPCDPNDINRDGHIDLKDFALLQADFDAGG